MDNEEIRSTIEQIKAQVKAKPENKDKTDDEIDEMILESFYKAYTDGKMTKEDLGGLAEMMGYEFTEEFDQDPAAANEVNPEEGGEGEGEATPGATQEDLKEVRTMEPGESAEEFKDKIEEVKEGQHVDEDEGEPAPADDPKDDEDDEDDERKKASELWKMNLNK
jgi:hypothetical protein